MKKFLSTFIAAFAAAFAATFAMPAMATEDTYRVDANDTDTIQLKVCAQSVLINANGDNDTDLDFWLYGPDGGLVTSDTDRTDLFIHRINRSAGLGCEYYRLEVKNLGNVYNQYVVTITEGGGTASNNSGGNGPTTNNYRVNANDTDTITIKTCQPSMDIRVNGDNDTDLDFFLYDPNGNLVFTDEDRTDLMIYTLRSRAGGGTCLDYRLEVKNLGNVYNAYTVTISR